MVDLHPKYITGNNGEKLVTLPQREFHLLLEQLEDMEDVKLYDEAKNEDDGTRVSLSDYIKQRKHKDE